MGKKLTEKMMPRLKASTVITHRKSPGSTAEEMDGEPLSVNRNPITDNR